MVAKYAIGPSLAKPYLYPVLAPSGVGVTRNWPIEKGLPGEATTDHVHQKSVWFCHGDVIPEGIELKTKSANKADKGVDFWSEAKDKDGKPRHGKIVCVKVGEPKQIAKNHVSIATHNEWITPDGVKIMDEDRVIHFIDRPEGRLFELRHHAQGERVPDHVRRHEGGFVRHPRSRRSAAQSEDRRDRDHGRGEEGGAAGRDNLRIWGYPTAWIDYSGKLDGKEVGIAVFDHPSNPPASWHVRAYGLNAANPFARDAQRLPVAEGARPNCSRSPRAAN